MNERETAEKKQREINELVDQARTLLQQTIQGTLAAFDQVKQLLGEAEALARKFNRTDAQTFLLTEEYRLCHFSHLLEALQNAQIVTGPATLMPAVKVRLHEALNYRDFPRGSIAVLPKGVVEELVRRSPPGAFILEG